MRRVVASTLGLIALLGACDAVEASRKTIEQTCLANGEPQDVCSCLARESAERLDPAVLDIMVIGAKGQPRDASSKARALDAPLRSQLAMDVPAIMVECGASAN